MKAKEAMQALIEVQLKVQTATAEDDAKTEELNTAEKELRVAIKEEGTEDRARELLGKVFALRAEAAAAEKAYHKQQRLYEVRATAFLAAIKKEKLADFPPDESKRFYCDGWIAVVSFPSYNLTLNVDDLHQVAVL